MTAYDEGIIGRLMNWWGRKYTNLPGHHRPTIIVFDPLTLGFCMNDSFFGDSRCNHDIPIRSNSEEEAREALSPAELSKPASVEIYRNRGGIQVIAHQHPTSRQQLLGKNEAQCDLRERIKISQKKRRVEAPNGIT